MAKTFFEAFSDEFFRELRGASSNTDAFNRASRSFENKHNLQPPSFDSFRKKHERSINKKTRR